MSPQYLFVEINRRCNLRCQSCDFWKDRKELSLTDDQLVSMIRTEFAALGGKTVVTCGGEPTLSADRFWLMQTTAHECGITTYSVHNGTGVNPKNADRWADEGPTESSISIDSHDRELHNKWRGANNYDVAVRAMRLLAERRPGRSMRKIHAITVVCERSYRDLPKLFELCLGDIGVDKVKLNMAQPPFGWRQEDDWFPQESIKDPDNLLRVIDEVDRQWGLKRTEEWKADVHDYWTSIARGTDTRRMGTTMTTRQLCNSADRNMWVNWKGVVQLCPNPYFGAGHFRRYGDLGKAWKSLPKGGLNKCKRLCGISHSTRRSNSLEAA